MKKHKTISAITLMSVLLLNTSATSLPNNNRETNSHQTIYQKRSNTIEHMVDSIYNRMTPEERLAQLQGIRIDAFIENGKISKKKCKELIPNGIGHFSQYACMLNVSPNQLRDYVKDLQDYLINETHTSIPAIFHEEAITGMATKGATTFPQQIGMACTWNPELMFEKTNYTRQSMRKVGSFMALSPNVDIIRNSLFNRGEESYGEDCYLTSRMSYAFVTGLQNKNMENGVAACAKHFLGYGGGSENNEDNKKVLFEEILMPYDVLVRKANVRNVMTGYHQFKGKYCVFNKYLITDILRDYLQFKGMLVSDYGAISQKGKKEATGTKEDMINRASNALNAGCDMEFSDGTCFPYIPEAIKEGKISKERFEQAVKTTLRIKVELGLFNKNRKLYKEGNIDLNNKKGCELAYKSATQAVVLLKNNNILPLKKGIKSIALVGPNANSQWSMLGDYTYQVMNIFHRGNDIDFNYPKIYTLKESLENKLPKSVKINYERGCDWSMNKDSYINMKATGDARFNQSKMDKVKIKLFESTKEKSDINSAIIACKKSEIIIAAVGENLTLCGEGRWRKGVNLPGDQEAFVEKLIDTGKPVVLIVFGGRAQVLSKKINDNAAAIIQAWYPGQEGGNALADILTGKVNPSGKMSITYVNKDGIKDICYNQGDIIKKDVAYPFGYGLSYTKYRYSDIKMPKSVNTDGTDFKISCKITNIGKYQGEEIVQLYVSPKKENENYRPIQLKGFKRVSLKPNETKEVSFTLSPMLMKYFKNDKWQIEASDFTFKIGASSTDIRLSGDLQIKGKTITSRNRDIYFSKAE